MISKETGISGAEINKLVRLFFGHRFRKLIKNKYSFFIKYFGTFYFHKKTAEAAERRRQETFEYNMRIKQKLYDRRKKARLRKEREIYLSLKNKQ